MATNTEGERALADLEAGKFSFPMVDSIRDHVNQLDAELQRARTELQRVNSLHEGAVNQLRQQEFTILRLEGELRKLNARLYALLKANVLTEAALRETKRGAVKFVEFLPVARKHAEESSKAALAYLSTIDLQAKIEAAKAHPLTEKTLAWLANLDLRAEWTKLKTHPLTTKALSELRKVLLQAKDNLPVVQKRIAALVEKATAYIAELQKKAA
ncbi:hypothetical protein F7D13_06185 [Methylocystis rosea]|uniref:Uncharacterized protein n=1 Tax=Methylocystis rosea TaxID=173366 RepID=A0ABX6EG40_9HYPH|nr:hypothetical protein [Methylocystis rosea]QGM93644.1 hypothetical protein F7D13_06185 [Methylocystis rosea]